MPTTPATSSRWSVPSRTSTPSGTSQVRETIEIMQGIWTNDLFEYHGEFADFDNGLRSWVRSWSRQLT